MAKKKASSARNAKSIIYDNWTKCYSLCQVQHGFLEVTPKIAEELSLCRDPHQRSFSASQVKKYMRAMRGGGWRPVTSTLWISSEDGHVIDGQHRIAAVIESGTPQYFDVKIAPRDIFVSVIDDNRKRSIVDAVRMSERRSDVKSSVTAAILVSHFSFSMSKPSSLTKEEQLDIVTNHRFLEDIIDIEQTKGIRKNAGILGAAVYAMERAPDPMLAKEFFTSIVSNNPFVSGEYCTHINVFTTWLLTRYGDGSTRHGHAFARECAIRLLKLWKAYLTGKTVKVTRYSSSEGVPSL